MRIGVSYFRHANFLKQKIQKESDRYYCFKSINSIESERIFIKIALVMKKQTVNQTDRLIIFLLVATILSSGFLLVRTKTGLNQFEQYEFIESPEPSDDYNQNDVSYDENDFG